MSQALGNAFSRPFEACPHQATLVNKAGSVVDPARFTAWQRLQAILILNGLNQGPNQSARSNNLLTPIAAIEDGEFRLVGPPQGLPPTPASNQPGRWGL